MLYRREIDGLRAIAIVPVILFHAGVSPFHGGYVGVDIFFVISGYLITSLLLESMNEGRWSIIDFYERRARRILPALFFVVAVTFPFAWYYMIPHQLGEFSQSLVAVSLFASNVLFWKQSDYFDTSSELKPLLHTWSLSVEEQYYVIFPIFLALVWRWGRRSTVWLMGIVAVISLLAAQIYAQKYQAATFYLLHTRAWELFLGGLAAVHLQRSKQPLPTSIDFGLIGLMMIVASIFAFDKSTPFPSFYALLPTVGAMLVILYSRPSNLSGTVLGHGLPVQLGILSYSAYLWHQPILAILKIRGDTTELGQIELLLLFIGIFPLSYLTYRFVETPFRNRAFISRGAIFSSSLAGIIAVTTVGYMGNTSHGFLEYKLAGISAENKNFVVDINQAKQFRTNLYNELKGSMLSTSFSNDKRRHVLIIGDSMGDELAMLLTRHGEYFKGDEFRLIRLQNMCIDPMSMHNDYCEQTYGDFLRSPLPEHSDLILVSFLWKSDSDYALILKTLDELKKHNKPMIIFGSAAFIDMASVAYKVASAAPRYTQDEIDRVVFNSQRKKFNDGNEIIKSWAQKNNTRYLDRKDIYCFATEQKCRIILENGQTLLWDNAHLTALGMDVSARRIRELGWLER